MTSASTTSTILGTKWHTLQHNGVAFPPPYQAQGLSIIIGGTRLSLNPAQEELVYAWAKKKDTHYVLDPIFQSNFLNDLKKLLQREFQTIDRIDFIDFSEVFQIVDQEKKRREDEKEKFRDLPREEKRSLALAKRAEKEKLKAIYAKAIVDDVEVDIANWLVE
ncbi:MAG TPA: DNA topoisomerase I, partial [Bacteroidia bacterium]|nr:DNA topoisomerase I [Bacteroidia bacterium]